MTQDESILYTMRIKTAKWEALKAANDNVLGAMIDDAKTAGMISNRVYRNETDPSDVLFVTEWASHDAMHKFGEEHGERFNKIAGAKPEDWEDNSWKLSDARSL